jgi:hypothetical protein
MRYFHASHRLSTVCNAVHGVCNAVHGVCNTVHGVYIEFVFLLMDYFVYIDDIALVPCILYMYIIH